LKSLLFIYKKSPYTESRFDTFCNLAVSALQKGLDVNIFFDFDGVLNTIAEQQSYESLLLPKDKISDLIDSGARVYLCGVCAAMRGLKSSESHIENVKFVSMEKLAGLIGKADRIIAF